MRVKVSGLAIAAALTALAASPAAAADLPERVVLRAPAADAITVWRRGPSTGRRDLYQPFIRVVPVYRRVAVERRGHPIYK